jgi:hypothetical protein
MTREHLHGEIILAGVLLAVAGGAASAEVWNVYPDSAGDAPTIQAAVDAAAEGDVIRLWPGDYVENVAVTRKSLTFEAAQGEKTAYIRSGELTIFHCASAHITNLSFSGPYERDGLIILGEGRVELQSCEYTYYPRSAKIRSPDVLIESCTFRDNESSASLGRAGLEIWGEHVEIIDSTFLNNRGMADRSGGALGAYAATTNGEISCTGCLFAYNEGPDGGAALLSGLVEFSHNTVIFNRSQDGAAVIRASSGSEIHENLFAWNDSYGLYMSDLGGDDGRCWCNGFWENDGVPGWMSNDEGQWWGLCLGPGPRYDSILADPLFCAPEQGDYHLGEGSPMILDGWPPDAESCETTLGAFGVGCALQPTLPITWGRLKSLYRP